MGLFSKKNAVRALTIGVARIALGPVGAAAVSVGQVANMVYDYHKDEVEKAKKDAYKDGIKDGNTKTKEAMIDKLEEIEKVQVGVYALAIYVATLDGDIQEEEVVILDQIAGKIETEYVREGLRAKLKAIYDERPGFDEICETYFKDVGIKMLRDIDSNVVRPMIWADDYEDKTETDFYKNQWLPFLRKKVKFKPNELDDDDFYEELFTEVHGELKSVFSQYAGKIQTVYVNANSDVTKGQPLFSVICGGGIQIEKSPVNGSIAILKIHEDMEVSSGIECIVIREA